MTTMLFQVEMDVRIPHGADPATMDQIKLREKERFQELQRLGKWRHIWRVVGHYRNTSIFDVESTAELHEILTGLPLFPFMEMKVTALCRHPSSIHDDDR
jgi:muconolactone D-isomerase